MTRTVRIGSTEVCIIDQNEDLAPDAQDAVPRPRLTLRVARGHLPRLGPPEPVFDSGGLWKVFREGAVYTFDLPHLSAVVDFSAGKGSIIMKEHAPRNAAVFDYPLDEVLFSKLLADAGSIIAHACGVDLGGRGILLCGDSGSGKSTLAGLFSAVQGAAVLSDDRVAAEARSGRAWITGTPWHGTAAHGLDRTVPLRKIFFLRHAGRNLAEPLAPAQAAARLASLSVIPYWHREAAQKALDATADLAECVPAADLGFRPDAGTVDYLMNLV